MFRSLPMTISSQYSAIALAASLALSGCATGPSYVAVEGGAQFWLDTSNQNELEGGHGPGPMFGAAVGARGQLHGIESRLELEATHHENEIHGRNGPGCNDSHCSADDLPDNVLQATSVMVNAWPDLLSWRDLSFYAGGGAGGAYVTGLRDEAFTPVAQVGAGVTWRFGALEADVGYRYWSTAPFELDRQDGRYHADGPVARLTWRFGQ
jgi:opacity protein-like surface antigen